jgi:hypothetical protein
MEVHHHSHSDHGNPLAGRAGKKWRNYLWEFFMLFMAVTAGFFVENQREHFVEQKRGMQYIESFVEDLKIDTTRFSHTINYYNKLDSLLRHLYICYDSTLHNQEPTDCMKNIFFATQGFSDLVYTDRTLQQLKNAGGLRLLDEEDANRIIKYDAYLRYILKAESTSMQEKANQVRITRNSVFAFTQLMDSTYIKGTLPEKMAVITQDKNLLNKFFNEVLVYRGACEYMSDLITKLRQRANDLINFYTEKYHLSERTPLEK